MQFKLMLATIVMVSVGTGAVASAADLCKGGPKDKWLSKEQIGPKLAALGLTNFVLAIDDGCLEAKVVKDGKRLEIYMEPLTGDVVKVKED